MPSAFHHRANRFKAMAKKASNRHLIYRGKQVLWTTCLNMLAKHLGYKIAEKKARDLAREASEKWAIPYKGTKEVIWMATTILLDRGTPQPKKRATPFVYKDRAVIPKLGAPHPDYVKDDAFYKSRDWQQLRYLVLKNSGGGCNCCGATAKDGAILHVDHIVPRYKAPELSLSLDNMQCLCSDCNYGKGAWDTTDWR